MLSLSASLVARNQHAELGCVNSSRRLTYSYTYSHFQRLSLRGWEITMVLHNLLEQEQEASHSIIILGASLVYHETNFITLVQVLELKHIA